MFALKQLLSRQRKLLAVDSCFAKRKDHQDYRAEDERNNQWTWAIVSQALDDIIDSSINNCFCQGYCREELDDLEDIEYELDNDSEDGIDVEIVQFPDGTALFRDVDTGVYYDDNQDVVEVDDKYGQLE